MATIWSKPESSEDAGINGKICSKQGRSLYVSRQSATRIGGEPFYCTLKAFAQRYPGAESQDAIRFADVTASPGLPCQASRFIARLNWHAPDSRDEISDPSGQFPNRRFLFCTKIERIR